MADEQNKQLQEMSLWDHVDALRAVLIKIVVVLVAVAWLLGNVGILHREFFKKYRRHAIVILLILAAVITPTGDPFTLAIVFLPIYLLYELSAYLTSPTKKS